MKLKLLAIGIILIMVSSTFFAAAEVKDSSDTKSTTTTDVKEIRVAIYDNAKEETYYTLHLKNYNWKVGPITYCFVPTVLSTKSILKGELTTDNYDVLIYSFDQSDSYLLDTGFSRLPKNKIIVRNIVNFIKDGGGYYGSCGAAAIAGGMKNKPKTFLERAMYQSSLGISDVEFQYNTATPILNEIIGRGPESVDTQAYLLYSGWSVSNPHDMNYSGICPDINISKDNPIFDDFTGNTRKIRWIGMSAFEIPEHPDREITVLARFPAEEISDNKSAQIYYWTYTGGISGLIKGLFAKGEVNFCKNLGVARMRSWLFAEDWKKTDNIVETHVANKAFMTSEIYPNENKARIVRCSGHPELVTWWGGHLQDVADTDKNNLYDGFYKLEGATPLNETLEDESTYNYCIILRSVAWAAKVPDNDLPPVYGPSQVSDIYPYIQNSSAFKIIGNAETSEGIASLDLYYRYSNDNTSWNNWTLYGTDTDGSDGWSWSFNLPNGTGYYQFYSIRNVKYEDHTETETAPPGPDAIVRVVL
jgi:hypothetical protein